MKKNTRKEKKGLKRILNQRNIMNEKFQQIIET